MAITDSKLTTLLHLQMTVEKIAQELANYAKTAEVSELIAQELTDYQKGHFEVAESIPTVETAESNILYLVENADTGFYDIYALIDGAIERIDDMSIDLSQYAKKADLSGYIKTTAPSSTGTGNAVTNVTIENGVMKLTKGSTFLTEHPNVTVGNDTLTPVTVNENTNEITYVESITRDENGHVKSVARKKATFDFLSSADIPIATETEITNMLNEVFG